MSRVDIYNMRYVPVANFVGILFDTFFDFPGSFFESRAIQKSRYEKTLLGKIVDTYSFRTQNEIRTLARVRCLNNIYRIR